MRVRLVSLAVFALIACFAFGCSTAASPAQQLASAPSMPTNAPSPDARPDPALTASNTLTVSVQTHRSIVYGRGADRSNPAQSNATRDDPVEWSFDEFAPVATIPRAAVVMVHGAGERRGEYGWVRLAKRIAEQGVMVFALDYPDYQPGPADREKGRGYREMADALGCAVRAARAAAAAAGRDDARIALVGFSLGGGIAAQIALSGDSTESRWAALAAAGGPVRQVECVESVGSMRVDALVGISGAYDVFLGYDGLWDAKYREEHNPEMWTMFSSFVGENPALRVRLLHSKADETIPYDNSVVFKDILLRAGYDVEMVDFVGGHVVPDSLSLQVVMSLIGD